MKAITTEVPRETDIKCINHSYTTATTVFSCQQFLNLREQADRSRAFYRTTGLDSSKVSTSRDKNSEGDALNWGGLGQQDKQVWDRLLDGILDSQKSAAGYFGDTWGIFAYRLYMILNFLGVTMALCRRMRLFMRYTIFSLAEPPKSCRHDTLPSRCL